MEQQKSLFKITIVLCAVAGFCDTVTFIAADGLFSAHVTGNFILVANHLAKRSGIEAWLKLLSFPVFVISVMVGGWIAAKMQQKHLLLFIEGILLSVTGIIAFVFEKQGWLALHYSVLAIGMLTVFAMGLQNAFGKLFSKETFGPTTMMTGNVTQWALDLRGMFRSGFADIETKKSFKKQSATIVGFLAGCLLGAVAGKWIGLSALSIAGVAMVACYLGTNKAEQ